LGTNTGTLNDAVLPQGLPQLGALIEITVGYGPVHFTFTHCVPAPDMILPPVTVQLYGGAQGADKQYSAVSPAHKHWLIHFCGTISKGLPATTVT
jgi:hypothetical protein